MRKRNSHSLTVLSVVAVTLAAVFLAASLQPHGSAQSRPADAKRQPQKNLRERAADRDVEVPGASESHSEFTSLDELTSEAGAIVYGQIIDEHSFFDEASPTEYGENITTEYTVQVGRVLKDLKRAAQAEPGQLAPAPLTTPLTIARNGGAVNVNGHRASVKVAGYEALRPGKEYVFFLFWSPDYKAYILAGGPSGAVLVNEDRSLKPLASSADIQKSLRGLNLESLIEQVGERRN